MRGDQLAGDVAEILLLHFGPAPGAQPLGQEAVLVDAVGAEQLDAAVLDQPGRRVGHAVVLPVVKAAALAGERQHRHAPRAVDLELHVPAQGRAPLLIISAFHHDAVASFA